MTATQSAPQPDPVGRAAATPAQTAATPSVTTEMSSIGRSRRLTVGDDASTPEVMRAMSVLLVVIVTAFGLVGLVAANGTRTATTDIRDNAGPVVVQAQTLGATLAEADAAATAAFLSGASEDVVQRRSYLDARDRAVTQVEGISALLGDDQAAHADLQELATQLTDYTGRIEAARLAGLNGVDGAQSELLAALAVQDDLTVDRQVVSARAVETLTSRSDTQTGALNLVAIGLGLLLVVVLLVVQRWLAGRTRRLLNIPLVVATVLAAGAVLWLWTGGSSAVSRTEEAQTQAFASIQNTAQVQEFGFRVRSLLATAQITGEGSDTAPLGDTTLDGPDGLFARLAEGADTDDERALVGEVVARWAEFETAVTAGTADLAAVSERFNGFSFAAEGVLAQNQEQFELDLDLAAAAVERVPVGLVALSALIAVLVLAGFQLRLADYR